MKALRCALLVLTLRRNNANGNNACFLLIFHFFVITKNNTEQRGSKALPLVFNTNVMFVFSG